MCNQTGDSQYIKLTHCSVKTVGVGKDHLYSHIVQVTMGITKQCEGKDSLYFIIVHVTTWQQRRQQCVLFIHVLRL